MTELSSPHSFFPPCHVHKSQECNKNKAFIRLNLFIPVFPASLFPPLLFLSRFYQLKMFGCALFCRFMNEPTEGHLVTVPVETLHVQLTLFILSHDGKTKQKLLVTSSHLIPFLFPLFSPQIPVETKIRGEVSWSDWKRKGEINRNREPVVPQRWSGQCQNNPFSASRSHISDLGLHPSIDLRLGMAGGRWSVCLCVRYLSEKRNRQI